MNVRRHHGLKRLTPLFVQLFVRAAAVLLLPLPLYGQCSFNAQVTEPDDTRGHGLVVTASGGDRNSASMEFCHYFDCRFATPRAGTSDGTPAEIFFSFECLRAGTYTWRALAACHILNDDGTLREYHDDHFIDTFEVPERLRRLDVQVLTPPTPAGNVRIDYDIDPSKRDAIIYIPGVAGAEQFVEGTGTLFFNVPPGTYKVTAAWCPGMPNQAIHVVPIEVKGTIPPNVIFNASPTDRVLIHKYGEDQYPSPLQTADGQIRINAVVRTAAGTPVAGQSVQFRLIDPPDTGPYTVRAGHAHVNDNVDGSGRLNGNTTATAVSNAAGAVSVTLGITGHASGDNYQVEAIASPTFDCSLAPCTKSQVYTAWKRVYVEVNKMFRRGSYLQRAVAPGSRRLDVFDVKVFPKPPFQIRLIHARAVGVEGGEDPFFYDELAHVVEVQQQAAEPDGTAPGLLFLDPTRPGLTHGYDGPESIGPPGSQRNPVRHLADAAGLVTGSRAADYYLPNGRYVNRTFADAFVEHVWLTDSGTGDADIDPAQPRLFYDAWIPHEPVLDPGRDHVSTEWLAIKWARHVVTPSAPLGMPAHPAVLPNHQILLVGSTKAGSIGGSLVGDGFSTVWLYAESLGTRLAGEALVHELAHQWLVNNVSYSGFGVDGHCDTALGRHQDMYNRRDLTCAMDAALYGNVNNLERSDGIVAFHYVQGPAGLDSEYLRIRRRVEPVPTRERTTLLPR